MIYSCCDDLRRNQIAGAKDLNGIDYLEVLDRDAIGTPDEPLRQRRLFLHFINDLAPGDLVAKNVAIEGGERIANLVVQSVAVGTGATARVMTIDLDRPGDFSIYTLRLLPDAAHPPAPRRIDPMFATIDFSFKVECPSDFDCRTVCDCPAPSIDNPEIDYLAKDYASFRHLMLDRMAFLMPQWQERHAADLGVALVEALAYVGDYLSYQQDAIATEAYLGTARRRISVRRHAKLVDYVMHDGCNARAWVQVQVGADLPLLPEGQLLCTRIGGQKVAVFNDPMVLANVNEFFETMEAGPLYVAHNELYFHTWEDQRCCLPAGATSATLVGTLANLKIGDVLIFEEVMGPVTGIAADADPRHRWVVRLTDVEIRDGKGTVLTDPLNGQAITQIRWADADSLPFALCISAQTDELHGYRFLENVSVARGNIVLVDHGRTFAGEALAVVPAAPINSAAGKDCGPCNPVAVSEKPPRYRPSLAQRPLSFAERIVATPVFGIEMAANDAADLDAGKLPADLKLAFAAVGADPAALTEIQGQGGFWSVGDGSNGCLVRQEKTRLNVYAVPPAASTMLQQAPRLALPCIDMESTLAADHARWTARRDLFESGPSDPDFVVETETDGSAWLRFGEGEQLGRAPQPGTLFAATYRVGNGVAGNVGAESIAHIVTDDVALRGAVIAVRNPLSATGGVEPESVDQVRAYAPVAFRTQERAVTEADYAAVTERHPQVQKAQATFSWTGSWRTVFITIDRLGGLPVDAAFKAEIRGFVERFRMAGYDLEIDAPRFVSLEIALHVCVRDGYFREDVKSAVLQVFSDRLLPEGRRGLFHPDNFTFGQTVYLSPLIAAAQEVEGVEAVYALTFRRQGTTDLQPLEQGKLEIGRLEIARCANDPNFAERGVFTLTVGGGK